MVMRDQIFREYDIRGVVGRDFDAEFARALGQAYGSCVLRDQGPGTVAVGYDCRLSSPELSEALRQGICDTGLNVLDCGMGPTPQLYYMVFSKKLQGGIQVTGSHNPGDQNGFKMMIGLKTLSGKDIQQLKELVKAGELNTVSARGTVQSADARQLYTQALIELAKPQMNPTKKLKVVVDGGNGVGGLVGPALLRGIGCEVIELYTDPDGRFPNHHPDPTELENIEELRERVVAEKADVGIAWDGDADRIGVVDEKGNPIFGDMLVLIFGRQLVKEVKNPIVIGDVKCSELLFKDLEKHGATAVMAKTGHSLIKAKLKELNAHLAGEMSGHIFFAHRFFGFDDGIHSAARLIEILSNTSQPLSQMLSDLPKTVSTPEIRVECPEEVKFKVAEQAKDLFPEYEVNTLDGARISFSNGWGLVRASNTQPVLVMRFEADTAPRLAEYEKLVKDRIAKLVTSITGQ